jgi:hypothetical protein
MNEENPCKNQDNPEQEKSSSSWEFFIAKEEMSEHLNTEESKKNSHGSGDDKKWWIVRFFTESNATDWAIVGLTAALVIVGYWQWEAISGQLEEMKKGGADTHELAVQAKNQADRTKELVELSEKSLRVDQRAWVGPNGAGSCQIRPNEEAKFTVVVTNTGKSPALHTYAEYTGKSILKGSPMDFTYPAMVDTAIHSSTVLQPGMLLYLNSAKNPTLNQTQINMLQSGQMIAYIFGKIRYDDIFGKTHHTKFCMVVDRDLKTLKTCGTYNEAD